MKLAATLTMALGVATVVAGCLAFTFGLSTTDVVNVVGFGPMNGLWEPADYCFLGTILAAVGSGLLAFSLIWVALLLRHGPGVAPRGRAVVWSLALALGAAGVAVGAASLYSQQSPRLSRGDAESARMQVTLAITKLSDGKDVRVMTTPEYWLRAQKKPSPTYGITTIRTTATEFHDNGQITVKGIVIAVTKTTELRMGGDLVVGAGVASVLFDPPKEITFTSRLVRGENNLWLIDELAFHEP
jgi:hypothetical protein